MATTYTKLLSGEWGLRSTEPLMLGATVVVSKRDGSSKNETVGAIVFSGDGITLARIGAERDYVPVPSRNRRRGSCGCDCDDCSPRCRCDPHCVCRGGNIYDC